MLLMSVQLLRQARASHSLSAAYRSLSRCRCNSTLAAQPRLEQNDSDSAPVAGPSNPTIHGGLADSFPGVDQPIPEELVVPLDHFSRIELHLAGEASGTEPTLEDLNMYKSERPDVHSSKYAGAYTATLSTLMKSFTKEQLRRFLLKASVSTKHSAATRKKVDYAESIMEQIWKWPKLADVEQAKRDRTEIVTDGKSVLHIYKGAALTRRTKSFLSRLASFS